MASALVLRRFLGAGSSSSSPSKTVMPSSVEMAVVSEPTSKSESTPRRMTRWAGFMPSAVFLAAVRTEMPGGHDEADHDEGDEHQAGAPRGEQVRERATDGDAEVAAGVDDVVERGAGLGATPEQVEQAGHGDHDQGGADDEAHGVVGGGVVALPGATQEQGAADDEPDRGEDAQAADEGAEGVGEAAAEGAGHVGVDAEAGEQAEGDEGDTPHVVAVTGERLADGAGGGRRAPRRRSAPWARRNGPWWKSSSSGSWRSACGSNWSWKIVASWPLGRVSSVAPLRAPS